MDVSKLFTRRAFLRGATFGLGTAALSGALLPLALRTRERRPRADRLGVALVGLGNYATHQLAPALQETEDCYLAAIVTGTPAKAEAWSQKYGIAPEHVYDYDTFDRIADDDAVDIVYVVLPNSMHAEYTIRAAQAGKHVICEKPMATSVADAEAMIEACRQADRLLSIGYRLHFEPHHREMMRLGQEQVFGPVKVIEASFGFRIGDPNQWRLDKQMAGGGALMDVGIYAIQGARYVTGEEPVAVTAQAFTTDHAKFDDVEETILWTLEFPSGAVASSSTTYNGYVNRLYATAPEGWFETEPSFGYSGIQGRTSRGAMDFPAINQQAAQMDAFAACVRSGRPSEVSGEEGLRDMKVIEGIYRSIAEGGRRVALSI